jgi:hypothetical protein
MIASVAAFVVLVIAIALFPALNSPQHAQALGMAMLFLIYGSSFAVQALTKPVYTIALMLFYYDQRIRNEGFDIEWMMERAGLVPGWATTSTGLGPLPSGEFTPAPSVESMQAINVNETVEMDRAFEAAPAQIAPEATEATEQTETSEAKESTEATQQESGV